MNPPRTTVLGHTPAETAAYTRLGLIVLEAAGETACLEGYGTTDPEWVGKYAMGYGDINPDGTLN